MPSNSIKILLVEDNPGDAKLVEEELSAGMDLFFDITLATSLQDGINKLKEKSIDVILLDLALPDSSGISTLEKINAEAKHIPIVILSGTKDEDLALGAVRDGAQDYLVKSEVNNVLLTRTIRHAIQRHKIYQELERCKTELERYKDLASKMVSQ